jgi:hypothetical protein
MANHFIAGGAGFIRQSPVGVPPKQGHQVTVSACSGRALLGLLPSPLSP